MLNFLRKEDGKRERRGAKSAGVGKSPTMRKGSPREGLED